jgi:hypothetical protein
LCDTPDHVSIHDLTKAAFCVVNLGWSRGRLV